MLQKAYTQRASSCKPYSNIRKPNIGCKQKKDQNLALSTSTGMISISLDTHLH